MVERSEESAPAVRVSGAVKRFGNTLALAGLDLDLHPGEWLGLLGANGAGKTTAMHAICGLIDLDEGNVELFGSRVSGPTPKLIGWVPQEIALYTHLTAKENLRAFGRLHGLRGDRLDEALCWALRWTGLQSRADERVGADSAGQRRLLERWNLAGRCDPGLGVEHGHEFFDLGVRGQRLGHDRRRHLDDYGDGERWNGG